MFSPRDTCSTTEAAKRLGVALSTVQSWVETGALEAWKTPGGHRRVMIKSVDRLLEKGISKRKPVSEINALRVLVVEDDNLMMEIYSGFFRKWRLPVSVSFTENGYEALLRIGYEIPDLIITDLSMPEIDGFQMIRSLRQYQATAKIQIIVVSGLSDADIDDQGGLPEDILVLHKPVKLEQLHQLMNSAVQRCHMVAAI